MKTFTIIDKNKPSQFFTDCVGCVLEPKKYDQIVIYTASGQHFNVGPQMMHDLSFRLYDKILEAGIAEKTIIIPDMSNLNEDEIRVAIDELEIK